MDLGEGILIVRQDKLGDCLLTTPIPVALAESVPRSIQIACRAEHRELFLGLPAVRQVHSIPYRLPLRQIFAMRALLGRERIGSVLLCKENSSDFALAARLAGVPTIAGFTQKASGRLLRPNLWPLFEPKRHEVLWLAQLASQAVGTAIAEPGPLLYRVSEDAQIWCQSLRLDGPLCVFSPFTGGTNPSLSLDECRRMISDLTDLLGLVVIVTGAEVHRSRAEEVCALTGALCLAGETTLQQLAALYKDASLAVTANTANVHLAASQGTPTVVLETNTDPEYTPERWSPWKVRARVIHANQPESRVDDASIACRELLGDT